MSSSARAPERPGIVRPFSSFAKPLFWTLFALMALSAFIFTSLPILNPAHPLHALLYSQRWLLIPHIAGGVTALVLGPLQFSRRLRQQNPARHRLLGKTYVAAVSVAAPMAPLMAWHYPAFFPYSVTTNALLWLVATYAALFTARAGRFDQHRRWMARSYAMVATFVLPRVPVPIPTYNNMTLEQTSYALLIFTIFSLIAADFIVDFSPLPLRRT